ncbi:hypothetical protein Tsubulata_034214, partial [Turnera subulata]
TYLSYDKMASHYLFMCLLFLTVATAAYGGSLGGWEPVSNHDPHIREVGEFAVRAYNEQRKTKGAGLMFESVLKAARQVVSGHNYRLVLAAEDGVLSRPTWLLFLLLLNHYKMASHFLLLCSLFLLAATTAYGGRLGDWQPISSRDPHIREIGEFAVHAYHATLKLKSVLKAERQVVSGYNYRLVLTAKDGGEGGAPKKYVAVVYEKEKNNYKLKSFTPLS